MACTDTVQRLLGILRAAIRRAQAREYVQRNVALLCDPPRGRGGRPSKSLTLPEATSLLAAADQDRSGMRAYVIVAVDRCADGGAAGVDLGAR